MCVCVHALWARALTCKMENKITSVQYSSVVRVKDGCDANLACGLPCILVQSLEDVRVLAMRPAAKAFLRCLVHRLSASATAMADGPQDRRCASLLAISKSLAACMFLSQSRYCLLQQCTVLSRNAQPSYAQLLKGRLVVVYSCELMLRLHLPYSASKGCSKDSTVRQLRCEQGTDLSSPGDPHRGKVRQEAARTGGPAKFSAHNHALVTTYRSCLLNV